MNELLQNKLDEIKSMAKGECWYIVKQQTSFIDICYLVAFLRDYQQSRPANKNLETYIKEQADLFNQAHPNLENISSTHRALRVAAFFGLIYIESNSKYDTAIITDVFYEIEKRCQGVFENTDLYSDIIKRQIEKMFISSSIDEEYETLRSKYRLYPVMLLYKILLELGLAGQKFKISIFEYRYLVATTKTYQDFLDTLLLIKLSRGDTSIIPQFEQFREKVDNRLIQVLKQLDTLEIDTQFICLAEDKIKEVSEKVYNFEQNNNYLNQNNYIDFLTSDSSLTSTKTNDNDGGLDNNSNEKGSNTLLYGVAGVGKSHTINQMTNNDKQFIERVVFHPDYLNTDFVGQIAPIMEDGQIAYKFKAGAFTKILRKAIKNPNHHHYLIVEEINRGNAPAIFGEIFQLLDRDQNGRSQYEISHDLIADYVYSDENHMIHIPSNLSILATMNTADQNVFTLDTAFQRRWSMRMIDNDINNCKYKDQVILDTGVTWQSFNNVINDHILHTNKDGLSSEDKRLGAFFVREDELKMPTDLSAGVPFAEKVIKYLWDDVFKFNKAALFQQEFNSLDEVLSVFKGNQGFKRFEIFDIGIQDKLQPKTPSFEQSTPQANQPSSQQFTLGDDLTGDNGDE